MLNTLSTPIANTLLTPIAGNPAAPSPSYARGRLHSAGSALGRAAAGFAFVGVLAAANELLGPAGLPFACGLAMLAIGAKFSTQARRSHDA